MKKEFAAVNGCKIAYSLEGDDRLPVVVLSHALATRAEIWSYQIPLLAGRFRVLAYDTRGHGESGSEGDSYSIALLASDLAKLLDHLNIPRVALVGLSLGGMIAQQFALSYPDRLSSLILCSTGSQTSDDAKAVLENRIAKVRLEGISPQIQPTIGRWFTSQFIEEMPCTIRWVSDLIRSTSVDGYIGCCRALQQLDLTAQLSQVRTRTLLIPGSEDAAFPERSSRTIQEQIAGSRLVVLRGAAHLGPVERAHEFNEIVLPFLSDR